MKLYATVTSDHGKPIAKSSNEAINITFTEDRRQKFDITFTGDKVKVMSYYDASWHTIEYVQGSKKYTCEKGHVHEGLNREGGICPDDIPW